MLPRLTTAWREGRLLAAPLQRWLLISWLLGFYAVIPSFARYAGVPQSLCAAWWVNVFLFHPLINRLIPHGNLLGQLVLILGFVGQYAVLLAALVRARRPARFL